jgi:peptidoglycan lytic transglycosylase
VSLSARSSLPANRSIPYRFSGWFPRCGALRLAFIFALSSLAAGCAHRTYTTQAPAPAPQQAPYPQPAPGAQFPPPSVQPGVVPPAAPGAYVEEGIASWYGAPFNGRRASDGEIYDMHQMTAAHRTLPFGSIVQVTNLTNGRQVDVRITDRGPFVANRIIDLSYAAAEALGVVGPGTAPVRLQVLSGPNPMVGFFGVQVGAFEVEANAERLRAGLSARYSPIDIVSYDSPRGLFYRVRVGREPTEAAARQLAAQLRAGGQSTTFVVRLDN